MRSYIQVKEEDVAKKAAVAKTLLTSPDVESDHTPNRDQDQDLKGIGPPDVESDHTPNRDQNTNKDQDLKGIGPPDVAQTKLPWVGLGTGCIAKDNDPPMHEGMMLKIFEQALAKGEY